MSLRLEMLQVARLAPKLLGESTGLVEAFIRNRQNDDGGFADRDGDSDLYYTVFAIDSLIALNADIDFAPIEEHLRGFGDGEGLDFVHLGCLARAWSALPDPNRLPQESRRRISERIREYQCPDGGFNPDRGAQTGTAYGAFLALHANQDLRLDCPDPDALIASLKTLETPDGAWTNDSNARTAAGSTNAAAAAIVALNQLEAPIRPEAADWLLNQRHAQGGFRAMPAAPIPDLLSTATSLHALATMGAPIDPIKESCLDYIDTLWTNDGSFYGNWLEEDLDCEYTFYGLLALGHLSL